MIASSETSPPASLRLEIGLLFQTALLIFVFTVTVGILNGTDIVDFDEKTILTHVHTGTLGWITASVFAAAFWLFAKGPPLSDRMVLWARLLTFATIVTVLAYNVAFLTTYGETRPTLGGFMVAAIAGVLIWIAVRARQVELTTPHLGILAAVVTSVTGGVLGVLLGIQLATGNQTLPEGGEDAHPATMVLGFLVPVGMALAEWCFTWPQPERATRLGAVQMTLPFIGGVLVIFGILLDAPPLLGLSLPFEVAGVVILLRRMWPRIRAVRLVERGKDRLATLSATFITINIGLFVYLIANYQGDLDDAPEHEILALDHLMFIGVMTNAIFGLLYAVTDERRARWPWADHLIFWGMNIGLAGFAVGLFWDVTILKQLFTPLMGASILLAIAAYTARLRTAESRPRPAVAEAT